MELFNKGFWGFINSEAMGFMTAFGLTMGSLGGMAGLIFWWIETRSKKTPKKPEPLKAE